MTSVGTTERIHILEHARTLCGAPATIHSVWVDEHPRALDAVNCGDCKKAFSMRRFLW